MVNALSSVQPNRLILGSRVCFKVAGLNPALRISALVDYETVGETEEVFDTVSTQETGLCAKQSGIFVGVSKFIGPREGG